MSEIREQIAMWFQAHERPYTTDTIFKEEVRDSDYELADQILYDVKARRGGGKCPRSYIDHNCCDTLFCYDGKDCPACKGTGKLPVEEKSLGTLIKEFED